MRFFFLFGLILITVNSASAIPFFDKNDTYISSITELPYSHGTPRIEWQVSGNIHGWIDIVGFNNLSRRNGQFFINANPNKLAIILYDAYGIPPSGGVLEGITTSLLSVSQSDTRTNAQVFVVMYWKNPLYCSDENGSWVCGWKHNEDRAIFQDTITTPEIINSSEEIQVTFTKLNVTYYNSSYFEIKINDSIYDRYMFTNVAGHFEKINRLWHVEQTTKGIYFANESRIDIFKSDNISHTQNIISTSDLNFTITASGLYSSTNIINLTKININSDPVTQFLNPNLVGFLSILSIFCLFCNYLIKGVYR